MREIEDVSVVFESVEAGEEFSFELYDVVWFDVC